MNVNGVGGAAMLGMTVSGSSRGVAIATGSGTAAGSGTATGSAGGTVGSTTTRMAPASGEARLPGQRREATAGHETATRRKEAPRPPSLPPLRGLTVAEIRAMLGVAPLQGQVEAAATETAKATGSTSIIAAALRNH